MIDELASTMNRQLKLQVDAVEDSSDGVGAVEHVEVNSGHAGGQQSFDLFSAMIDADRRLDLCVVLATLKVGKQSLRPEA